MNLKDIQKLLYEEYQKNGYEKYWNKLPFSQSEISIIAELGFITTEVAEGIEEVFKISKSMKYSNNFANLGFECADIIIRTLNLMSRLKLNAEYFILQKNTENLDRGYLHGKKR